ncbi:CorA family divalent cation transporter [Candidatus Parcubacteria bacterium]|nr:CorA family divalent cation transporter [Candidatus Parcubacteria bacterium]
MITRHERGSVKWVDLEAPTREELRSVMGEFSIDPAIEEEIIIPTPYPLMVGTASYAYLILHFPTADAEGGARNQEVDIIVGKEFLITVRYEVLGSIQSLHKAFEAEELMGIPSEGAGAALVERVLRRLYAAIGEETERIARMLERIEQDIFAGKERQTVRAISEAGRVLLRFDTALARHTDPLSAFLCELQTTPFFGKRFSLPAARIEAERAHAANIVGSYRAVARELRTTNDSLLSSSQSEAMKTFTAIALATFPMTLVAAAFTIPAEHTPIIGTAYDFWFIIGIMILVDLVLFAYLKTKRWI